MPTVFRTYMAQMLFTFVGYTVGLIVFVLLLGSFENATWIALAALLPTLPIAYGVWSYTRILGQFDELQQRIHLNALAFAAGIISVFTVGWSFLEMAGFPRLPLIWVFPLLTTSWGFGLAFASRRYE